MSVQPRLPVSLEELQRELADARRENLRFRTLILSEAVEAWAADSHGSLVEIICDDGNRVLPPEAIPISLRLDLVHPADQAGLAHVIEQAKRSGQPFSTSVRGDNQAGHWRHLHVRGFPVKNAAGTIDEWVGLVSDETASVEIEAKNVELRTCLQNALETVVDELSIRKRIEELLVSQNEILECIALGQPLDRILTQVVRMVESRLTDTLGSVMLRQGGHLSLIAGQSLPEEYCRRLVKVPIGEGIGSCGTAVHRGQPVIVSDIEHDPLWQEFTHWVLPHGIRACWSVPIISRSNATGDAGGPSARVLGSFALYHRQISSPSGKDLEVVTKAAHLAAIAIERELNSRALHESEAKFRQFAAASEDVFWIYDIQSQVPSYVSPAALKLFGEPPENFLNPQLWIDHIVAEDREQFTRQQAAANAGSAGEGRFRVRRQDGQHRWIHNRWFPIRNEQGELCRVAGTLKDVTESVITEERLARQTAELSHASRVSTLGLMAAAISHEINQPLNAISNYANACSRCLNDLSEENRELLASCFERMGQSALQAGEIVRRLRSFVRKESARQDHHDFNLIVRDALGLMGAELRRREVRVDFRCSPEPASIVGDAVQLQQVIMNLLTNAADAMADQPASRRLIRIDSFVAEKNVECRICDSGPGFGAAVLAKLFEPFLTTKDHGSGIGLSICRNILNDHGGSIQVTNCSQGGAVVTTNLPLTDR